MERYCIFVLAIVFATTQSAAAENLVINGGFETVYDTTGPRPTGYGYWRGNASEIVPTSQGITPFQGSQMLNFIYTIESGPAWTKDSEVWQIIDISSFGAQISAAQALASASFHFNRVDGDAETDTEFTVGLYAYAGDPCSFPSQYENSELAARLTSAFADGDPDTWELAIVDLVLPANTDFLVVEIAARENIFNDTSDPELEGHYADAVSVTICSRPIIYVDADANGANDGSSWADAVNYLQDALAMAIYGDEIRMAEGTYKPDRGAGITRGDRYATFQIKNGVTVNGGYAGFGTPDPNTRDIRLYETILSGDLADNDVEVTNPCELRHEPTRAENSYHVVTASGTDETAVFDGFTITAGNANVDYWRYGSGGAMFNENGSPTLASCRFIANSADNGGAMYNTGRDGECKPILVNCVFSGNYAADEDGGAMYNSNSKPRLTYCSFTANCTSDDGGAMYNHASTPTLTNCTFRGNFAFSFGGAMSNRYHSSAALTNCTFVANSAKYDGGAIGNLDGSSPTLTNCIFTANLADTGAAMHTKGTYDAPCHPTLTNCTFAQNSANNGNALACDSSNQQYPSDLQVTNSILWDGGDEIWNNDGSTITITYSDVEDSWPGEGNIDRDPCFIALGYWDATGAWVESDYHLLPGSPCIDAGNPNYVPASNETDLDGKPRVVDGDNDGTAVVDMGAYEANYVEVQMKFTPQALNPGNQGRWFKLHFVLLEESGVEDVDVNKPSLCRLMDTGDVIESNDLTVFVNQEDLVEIEAAFDRGVFSLCSSGLAKRNAGVLGLLAGTGGQYFYGTDTIKIINKTWEHMVGLTLHWLEADCGEPDWCGGIDLNQDGAVDFVDLALFGGCSIEIVTQ